MKTAVLCGITLFAVAPVFAQTSAPGVADQREKLVTMTGCVDGGADSRPITLSQAMIVPGTPRPGLLGRTPSPVPPPVSSTETQPVDPPLPPLTARVPGVTPSPTGTSGTKTPPMPAGVVTGTAPAGSSGSSVSGYRLTGTDLHQWIGKRVQVIGTFAPASAQTSAPAPAPGAGGAASAPPAPEFRVQTVVSAAGPCPR